MNKMTAYTNLITKARIRTWSLKMFNLKCGTFLIHYKNSMIFVKAYSKQNKTFVFASHLYFKTDFLSLSKLILHLCLHTENFTSTLPSFASCSVFGQRLDW